MYEEKDDSFYMSIGRTRDDKYITIGVESTVSSETRYALAAKPDTFKVLAKRERDVEYHAEHFDGRWVIRTNADDARNFKLVTAPTDATTRKQWTDWVAHDDSVYIENFELFDGFTAIEERSGGLERVRLQFNSPHMDVRALAGSRNTSRPTNQRIRWGCRSTPNPTPLVALQLHLADHAGDHLRAQHADRRAQVAQAATGDRLRRQQVCDRTRVGDRARRCQGAGVAGL